MAIDNKYGRVTVENGDIGEDEPVVVFRAQDALLPKVLMYYHLFCLKFHSPRKHLDLIVDSLRKVEKWQLENPDKVQVPRSRARRKQGDNAKTMKKD